MYIETSIETPVSQILPMTFSHFQREGTLNSLHIEDLKAYSEFI